MYLLDQYSTTHDQDRLGDWEDSSPEDVRSEVTRMREVLRRYPVNAKAPDIFAARLPVEDFAEDRCGASGATRPRRLETCGESSDDRAIRDVPEHGHERGVPPVVPEHESRRLEQRRL